MSVLVTGAAGFLGSRLVARLAAKRREVVAVARRARPEGLPATVRWLQRDLAAAGLASGDLDGVETVVHLAGATLGAGTDEAIFLAANEQTTVHLLQVAMPRVKRVVFASSQVVYGDARSLAVTESFPLRPEASAYACSKINAEAWLRWFRARHGGVGLALRLCGFVEGGGIVDYLIDRALAGEPMELFANGEVRRDYLGVADGVAALEQAIDAPCPDGFLPINVGSGCAVSAREYAALVCAEIGDVPVILRDTAAPQGDFALDASRARSCLGFAPADPRIAARVHARSRRDSLGIRTHA